MQSAFGSVKFLLSLGVFQELIGFTRILHWGIKFLGDKILVAFEFSIRSSKPIKIEWSHLCLI